MKYFINKTDEVVFETSIYQATMTGKDLDEWHSETILMKDAILMILNPTISEDADLYFSDVSEAKEYLKTIFSDGNWNQDFITKIFNDEIQNSESKRKAPECPVQ